MPRQRQTYERLVDRTIELAFSGKKIPQSLVDAIDRAADREGIPHESVMAIMTLIEQAELPPEEREWKWL